MRLNLKDDRGSLVNTLVFISVGFLLTSLMTSWMMTRINTDYAEAQDAQIRSAIDSYSQSVLESVNVYGPQSVTKCAGSTPTPTCSAEFPDLKARVIITKWAPPASDGTIVATLSGVATVEHPIAPTVTTNLKLTLSGVGTYLGLSPTTGRPLWTKAGGAADPTALWNITPTN